MNTLATMRNGGDGAAGRLRGGAHMAVGTPFHARTEPLCHSHAWRQWSGYLTVSSYADFVQPEYAAIRNSAALIDVSPLYKYEVAGPDATAALNRIITQDAAAMAVGQVIYTPWCDADGKVRQEGTVFRLADDTYQVCAAEPAYGWIRDNAAGFAIRLADRSTELAALSLQGPHAREVLAAIAGDAVRGLKFFRWMEGRVGGATIGISRTGYTGDLGYELWIPRDRALGVWDALLEAGRAWQIQPCGLLAMDIARVEAGFILIGVDYTSSEVAHLPSDQYSPFELGLGWTVKTDKGPFVGRKALVAEKERGPRRRIVGLEIDWEPLEAVYMAEGLMPDLPTAVCRESVPVYSPDGVQAGRASSRVWSRLLKKYLAIATVDAAHAIPDSRVEMEVTVNYRRARVQGSVVRMPFFRPERMRS